MEQVPAGEVLTFEVTYQSPSLNVGLTIFNTTTGTPILVEGPIAMQNVSGTNTYVANFTGEDGETYLAVKAVYTDDTLTTVDQDFGQGSESFIAVNSGGGGAGGSGCELVGQIINNNPIVGYIESQNPVVGYIEC